MLSAVVRVLTRSPLAHCAVGFGGAVLDPAYGGDRFWPMVTFVTRYPTLVGAYILPAKAAPDMDAVADPRPKRALPTFVRWLIGGRIQTRDCVFQVRRVLAQAGIVVPDSVVSPHQLFNHLANLGARYASLSG